MNKGGHGESEIMKHPWRADPMGREGKLGWRGGGCHGGSCWVLSPEAAGGHRLRISQRLGPPSPAFVHCHCSHVGRHLDRALPCLLLEAVRRNGVPSCTWDLLWNSLPHSRAQDPPSPGRFRSTRASLSRTTEELTHIHANITKNQSSKRETNITKRKYGNNQLQHWSSRKWTD